MKKAALLALFPLLMSTQLSTAAHAQNAVALCNLYQMRGSSSSDVIRIPAPPQLAGANGGLVEIHKDGKVTANGQDITAATTSLCASNPQAGSEEAGMKGNQAAASSEMPVKHVVHHKHKATIKTKADTSAAVSGSTDITANPTPTPAATSTSGTLGQLPVNNSTGAMASPTAPSSTSPNTGASMPAQTVPTAPPGTMAAPPAGTPSPSPDQHQEKPMVPTAPPAQ